MADDHDSPSDEDYHSASDSPFPHSHSLILLAIQIVAASNILHLPPPPPLGIPRLKSPARTPARRSKSRPPTTRSTETAKGKQKEAAGEVRLRRLQDPLSGRFAPPPVLGECSSFSAVDSVVVQSPEGSSGHTWPSLRKRGRSVAFQDGVSGYQASAVPFVENVIELDEEVSIRLQEIRSNLDVTGSEQQVREVPGEDEQENAVTSESSVYSHMHWDKILSPTKGTQFGQSSSSLVSYVSDEHGERASENTGDDVVLGDEFDDQTDWSHGREGLDSEEEGLGGSHVYRMPEEQNEQYSNSILWPIGLAIKVIRFQVLLVVQVFSLVGSLFSWCNSFVEKRILETLEAKERAKEAVSQRITMISKVPPKVTEGGSFVLKRAAWGCLAATYVCLLLSMLLFPALLLDFIILNKIVEEPVSIREPLHFDYTKPHPSALVVLRPSQGPGSSRGKLLRYSENVREIPVSHRVHITVKLTLPESEYNQQLGVFQLTAELLADNGEVIKSATRPCILRFHSAPIRYIKTLLVSLPALMGIFSETQTLVVHLMEFKEQHVPTSAVRIVMQPKAGMPVGAGIPVIYHAEILIESQLPWLKALVRNWKWTIYIWIALVLYILEIIMVLCCCRQALVPKTWVAQSSEGSFGSVSGGENIASTDSREDGSYEGSVPQRYSRGKRRVSFDDKIPTARAAPRSGPPVFGKG